MKNEFEYFIKNLDEISASIIQVSSIQKKSYVDVAEAHINEYFQISNVEFVIQISILLVTLMGLITLAIISSWYWLSGLIVCLFHYLLISQYNECTISVKVIAFKLLLNNIEKISKD